MQQGLEAAQMREILLSYHAPLLEGIEDKALKYMELMRVWGAKMSLTSLREPEDILKIHFGESIFALSLGMDLKSRLADVGTGAGFPGLALKIAEPSLSVTLIEPNKKKCAFLHEIVRELKLEGVEIIASGYRESGIEQNSLSVVAIRALKVESGVLKWAKSVLSTDGRIWLWLGEEDVRRIQAEKRWEWGKAALIPGTKGRYIIAGMAMA